MSMVGDISYMTITGVQSLLVSNFSQKHRLSQLSISISSPCLEFPFSWPATPSLTGSFSSWPGHASVKIVWYSEIDLNRCFSLSLSIKMRRAWLSPKSQPRNYAVCNTRGIRIEMFQRRPLLLEINTPNGDLCRYFLLDLSPLHACIWSHSFRCLSRNHLFVFFWCQRCLAMLFNGSVILLCDDDGIEKKRCEIIRKQLTTIMLPLATSVYPTWIEFMITYSSNLPLWSKVMLLGIDCLIKGPGRLLIA